jgi:acyl-CoA thioester hydrolase
MPEATERSSYRIWAQDRLRYNDTDRQGHINNAVYATFFETARVGFVDAARAEVLGIAAEFVVARVVIDFRAELHYPGVVDIGTRVRSVGRSSIVLAHAVFKDAVCAATGESVLVQLDSATRRSAPLGPALVAWLRPRVDPQE